MIGSTLRAAGGAALRGLAVVALIALGMSAPATPAATPSLEDRFSSDWSPEDCGIFKLQGAADDVLCGYVSVPLHHEVEGSARIRLAVVVIPAANKAARRPDPLFLAQGGPGGSTIGSFAQVLLKDLDKRPVLNRDLVLWDQRGTYFSQPRLVCREASRLPDDATPAQQREATHKCGLRLAAEAGDLSAFNSQENARDADAVRAALGYEQFNFYGVSYGTELGQFLMRERPKYLRAVVLDAVVPLGFNLVTDVPAVKQRVMEQYARSCAESTICNTAYPNLGPRYLALLDRLDKSPVPLTTARAAPALKGPDGRVAEPDTIDGKDLDGALYQSIYAREAVPLLPYIIERAEQGDFSFALNFVQLMRASQSDMADGMYMTVVCSEYGDTPAGALQFSGVIKRFADSAAEEGKQILDACTDWKIKLLDKSVIQPVRSDIPTLLLSGSFDPITPPAHAERVAKTLSRGYTVTFARGTHGQAFSLPCANGVIAAFLDSPGTRPDAACANEAAPTFFTPDQLISLPARQRGGTVTIQEHLHALAGPAVVVAGALLLLFSAVPVYAVREVLRVFRPAAPPPPGTSGRLIVAAPWIPVLSGLALLGFIAVAAMQVAREIDRNQFLLLVGAVPAGVKTLTWLVLPYAAVMVLMTVAMASLWRHRARSTMGRVYYTLLVVAGWAVCVALLRTGFFGW